MLRYKIKKIMKLSKPGFFSFPEYDTIVILGADPIDGGMDTSEPTKDTRFDGEIMSIRIYNRALSEEEVRQNYRVDKIRFKIK